MQLGLPEHFVNFLVRVEKSLDDGFDVELALDPRAVRGKVGIREWIERNKSAFLYVTRCGTSYVRSQGWVGNMGIQLGPERRERSGRKPEELVHM